MPFQSRVSLRVAIFIICPLFFVSVWAQDLPGKKDSIQSKVLKEKRIFQVVLPSNFKSGSPDKYDVVYVLDGEGNTKLIQNIQEFINGEGFMPQTIIVGIFNTDRTRDLTPTREQGFETSGGADKFLEFLKNELVPYINANYPSDGNNTLFGHSFGALFAMYALLHEPQVFMAYIAADPSFWWGSGNLEIPAEQKLPSLADRSRTLFITGREGQGLREMRILPMDTILQKWAPTGLHWKLVAYPNETHGTVRLKSIYDGLKFTYSGYDTKPPVIHPMGGIVLQGEPFKVWYFDDTTRTRYTTDGTVPTLASSGMDQVISLRGPTIFSAKRFSNLGLYDKMTRVEFRLGKTFPAVSKSKKANPGGFHFAYFEGQWDKLPDFKTLKPALEGKADSSFDINKLPRKDDFGLVMEGQVEIKEGGYYVFALGSDDGSRLYLNGQLIIDNDGLHGVDFKSFILPLDKGFYPMRLEYFQKGGDRQLRLLYLTPTMIRSNDHPNPIPVPYASQFSE
jgi:predicted alpha/beta superfamily hydrolase